MTDPLFHLIVHTHWDREWYLPQAALQVRLVRVLDELVTQLAGGGAGDFLLDGQTVLLEDYLKTRPDLQAPVRFLIGEGRLQIGPWYVLPDELIPSAESLVRNLQLGRADAARFGGGRRLDVLYSPDAFGHPACLPALAAGFGLNAIVLWRGTGDRPECSGRDWVRWRAPGGQAVPLHLLPSAGYEIGAALARENVGLPSIWRDLRRSLVSRAAARHVAVFVGADHHAPPSDLGAMRDRVAAIETAGTVRLSRLDEYCAAAAAAAGELPEISGELRQPGTRSWVLQGVHGTRAPAKRRNALMELWLERTVEPLAALARTRGGRDRRPLLDEAWRTLVRSHFHDTICGCTSDAVAAVARIRWDSVEASGREIALGAWHELVGHDPDAARDAGPDEIEPVLLLWNPAARPRGGVVVADLSFFRRNVFIGPPDARVARPGKGGADSFSLATAGGAPVEMQILDRRLGGERLDASRHYPAQAEVDFVRVAVRVPSLPGLGFGALHPAPPVGATAAGADRVEVHARSLVNRFVVATLDPSGALTLFDRRTGERWLDLLRLESGGDAGDTYTFCPPARDRIVRSHGPIRVRRLARGPLLAALEARWTLRLPRRGQVDVRQTIMLHADSPVVRCILDLDNRATDHRLRARLPTGIRGTALAGAAFGVARRPPVTARASDYPLETPARTAPAHRFAAVAEGDRGLALLAPGFFEYEYQSNGDLLFTLLRAVGQLSRGDLPTRPGHAGWPTPTPGAQCLGPTRIELALVPLRERDLARSDLLWNLWEQAFTPIRGLWLREAQAGRLTVPPVDVTLEGGGGGLVLSSVAPADDGLVLRCYNTTERPVNGAWRFGETLHAARRTRLDGEQGVPLVLEDGGHRVRFVAGPGEIITVAVK